MNLGIFPGIKGRGGGRDWGGRGGKEKEETGERTAKGSGGEEMREICNILFCVNSTLMWILFNFGYFLS